MTDPGHARKQFPLADILSVTTGTLVSRRKMDGVCDLVAFITATPTAPRFMDRAAIRALLANTDDARAELIRQHPFLDDIAPPVGLDNADLYSWLVAAEEANGSELTVRCPHNSLPPHVIAAIDQFEASFKDGIAKLRDSFAQFTDVLDDAAARMRELAAAFHDEETGQGDDKKAGTP